MNQRDAFPEPSRCRKAIFGLLSIVAFVGCDPGLRTGDSTAQGSGDEIDADGPEPLRGVPAGARKLSLREYRSSLEDLLSLQAPPAESFQADTPVNGFASIGANQVAFSVQQIERFEIVAFQLAAQIFEDEARRLEFVGCVPATQTDPCVREFLTRFGRRVFRRPLTTEELGQFSALVEGVAAESGVWSGLLYAVAAFLQSPDFLYRTELGGPEADADGHHHLTAFELATRLSYLVTGSTPDDQLLDAAQYGLLDEPAGLESELERLLASPRSEDALARFLEEQFEVDRVGNTVKVSEEFPSFTPELAAAMEREMSEALRDVALRQPVDLLTLLTRRETIVNGPLASLYGLSGPASATEWVSATQPEEGPRAGLLGFAGFLASHAGPAETSATQRGLFILSKLLCVDVPSAPAGLDTFLPSPPEGQHATMRERVEQHMSDPSCSHCHSAMDPLGLALEHFNALGEYRELDNGLSIDATGQIMGESFDGARELGAVLRDNPEVASCLVRRFYEFALGTQDHQGAPTYDLKQSFEFAGRLFPDLVRALVLHEAFRLVSAPR